MPLTNMVGVQSLSKHTGHPKYRTQNARPEVRGADREGTSRQPGTGKTGLVGNVPIISTTSQVRFPGVQVSRPGSSPGCAGPLMFRSGFSFCGEQGLLFLAVHMLLIVEASLVAEHRL